MHGVSKLGSPTGQHLLLAWVTLNALEHLITFLAYFIICEKQYLVFRYIARIQEITYLLLYMVHTCIANTQ